MAGNGQKGKAPAGAGACFRGCGGRDRLSRLDAGSAGVRPLVLVGVAAGADEGRRVPGALVVGLVVLEVEPRVQLLVGDGFTGLVADEMLLVLHVRPARDLAAAAARVRLDGVLDPVRTAGEEAVIGTVGEARSAAGGGAAVRGVRAARDDDLVDRAGVEGMARQVGADLTLNDGA